MNYKGLCGPEKFLGLLRNETQARQSIRVFYKRLLYMALVQRLFYLVTALAIYVFFLYD